MNLFPGSYQSPSLETDPRAVKCGCGRLLYPGEVCCRTTMQEQVQEKVVKMIRPSKRPAQKQ